MPLIHLTAILGLTLFVLCLGYLSNSSEPHKPLFDPHTLTVILFAAALSVRILCAGLYSGFDTDTACFASWADRIFQVGPQGFYSPDVFTDYPPGYMYLLYPIGALRSLLGIAYYSTSHLILLRLPAILCDLGCGLLLCREAKLRCPAAFVPPIAAAYLFNPAVILNSSVWGQVDAVSTLAVAIMILSLMRERLVPAYVSFFAALLIKPQALFLLPVLLLGMLDQLVLKDFSLPNFLRSLAYGVIALCGAILLVSPFGLDKVWAQYSDTISSYPYAAVNAYNFWGLAGLNWISQDNTFLGLPFYAYGFAAISAAVTIAAVISIKHRKNRTKYPLLGALLTATIFVFSVRMHERYLFPVMLLLLLAYVALPSRKLFVCYGGFSLLHFYNTAHVLFYYDPQNFDRRSPLILAVSCGMLAMICFLYQTVSRLYKDDAYLGVTWENATQPHSLPAFFTGMPSPVLRRSRRMKPLGRLDLIWMAAITLLYSAFALYDLGDRQAPVTAYDMIQGQSLIFDFGENAPASLSYYIAPWHKRVFALEGRHVPEDPWVELGEITLENVFAWQTESIQAGAPYLRMTLQDTQASLIELVFLDSEGNPLLPLNAEEYPALFDEQAYLPRHISFRNSMYFDEIYHGRTAYEFLKGIPAYENTHPPLGKILIAAGVTLFGMNPFGWRIVGVLFGIAMVPLAYLFAKRLTGSIPLSAFACSLFAFDFMHLAQTRIATIDVYITFFVILMYYWMYCYSTVSYYDTPLKKTLLPLGACGVCMGLGIAAKWTGVYAGAGLAVIFFVILYRRYREYLYALQSPEGETGGIAHGHIIEKFTPYTKITVLFCAVFFVLIPALIYLLSYLPFKDYTDDGLFLRMLHNQASMFGYHSNLEATHSYSSPWYQWPFMVRPIWYFSGYPGGNLREGISAFGNPLVWWAGIPAFLYVVWLWMRKKSWTAAFLTLSYLAQYLPWVFVTRITFIYHYFPSVIFVVLMIVYSLGQLRRRLDRRRFMFLLILYGVSVFGLFVLYYPVLTGQPIEAAFVDKWLRWFDTWVLVGR